MRLLHAINFYLTKTLYNELVKEYKWARRLDNFNRKPVYVELYLHLLYCHEYTSESFSKYVIKTPCPNGLDPLLTEDQVLLLIQSSSLIDLPALTYLATSMHEENKQNKL